MFMSRVTLRTDSTSLKEVARLLAGGGYRVHQALWRLFGEDSEATRDFLYHQQTDSTIPAFFMVSEQAPQDRDGLWSIETKPYRPQLEPGQRLGFSLRVSPIVSRRDASGRQRRHDVVMDLKRQYPDPQERPPQAELVQRASLQWLENRLDRLGFTVHPDTFLAEGYRQHELAKPGNKVRFSTVDFQGVLTVTDPERMLVALYDGIGPAKAFGCGLMLVRRL